MCIRDSSRLSWEFAHELPAQARNRAVHPRLDGPLGDAEKLGDLRVGHVMQVRESEHEALALG